jgi:hypothetical protein
LGKTPEKTELELKAFLIDTEPLVAYLDQADSEQEGVATWLGDFTGVLCTTSENHSRFFRVKATHRRS